MRTPSRRLLAALSVLVVAVLSAGIAAAVTGPSSSGSDGGAHVLAAGDVRGQNVAPVAAPIATTETVPPTAVPAPTLEPAPTTTTTMTAGTPATLPPVESLAAPTVPAGGFPAVSSSTTTSTTVPPPPGPAGATFSLSPTSGPKNTTIRASGTGCVAGGTATGVGLYVSDPSGRPFTGDGGAAMPDGTWSIPFSFYGAPGDYTVLARCMVTNGPALFDYPVATFTITA